MNHYRLSESLIKRVIRYPTRIEEGILENTIACMRPAHPISLISKNKPKKYSEIWAMYVFTKNKEDIKIETHNLKQNTIKVITAWRYPGKSPERNPVPEEILQEARRILGFKDEP